MAKNLKQSGAEFNPGDWVIVIPLRNKGQILQGPDSRGAYEVAIGGLKVWTAGKDLRPASMTAESPADQRGGGAVRIRRAKHKAGTGGSRKLDLHGMRAEAARERLQAFLSQAVTDGIDQIEIIHGLGSGVLKQMVHEVLGKTPTVRSFRIDIKNPGSTLVYL